MNIYIASSYEMGKKIVENLKIRLESIDAKIFYPENIEISANTILEMASVSKICVEEIRKSDILVAVYPFGISVSIEIGRFLECQGNKKNKKLIILDISQNGSEQYNKLRTEAMLIPHSYKIAESLDELIKDLQYICDEGKV